MMRGAPAQDVAAGGVASHAVAHASERVPPGRLPTAPTRSARWGKATAPTPAATDRSDFCSIVSGLCPGYSSRVDDDDDDAWDDEADVEVLELLRAVPVVDVSALPRLSAGARRRRGRRVGARPDGGFDRVHESRARPAQQRTRRHPAPAGVLLAH